MSDFLTDIYSANELEFYIGQYDDGAGEWNYDRVAYRGDFSIDPGDNGRDVFDKLQYKGKKETQTTKTFEITQTEFLGWGKGLHQYRETSKLVIKIVIEPENTSQPTDATRYLTNYCTDSMPLDGGETDDMPITLTGNYDKITDTEPTDDSSF